MRRSFRGWGAVAEALERLALDAPPERLNSGQRAALRAVARRISNNGVLIADEVGMGKTRIAVEVAACVAECGGRVAIVVPPGLGYQWQEELRAGLASRRSGSSAPEFLRGLAKFFAPWQEQVAAGPRGWFADPLVLVSHAFTNWRLGERSQSWRWSLLPAVYAQARKDIEGRFPRDYKEIDDRHGRLQQAAKDICDASLLPTATAAKHVLETIRKEVDWPAALEASEYGRNDGLRQFLENAVGLGLGTFDLVIIDEAHKSRGSTSGLSNLLSNVIHPNRDARRLALTATPIELDAKQWGNSLARLGLSKARHEEVMPIIDRYAEAARRVRVSWRTSTESRDEYVLAARAFEDALKPYVLRRDKREDPVVRAFAALTGGQSNAYRKEAEVAVSTQTLSQPWKQIVCAAEALSIAARRIDGPTMKRLRLTIGNGHGIAALADQVQHDVQEDEKQRAHDEGQQDADEVSPHQDAGSKRSARVAWWRQVIDSTLASSTTEDPLLEHPAILAAMHAIEAATSAGEKVLVFGRFTRPMKALVSLLNARELLRRLASGQYWPQAKVHESDKVAVSVAHEQLQSSLALDELDDLLLVQYGNQRRATEQDRDKLLQRIRSGLGESDRTALALLGSLEARAASVTAADERHPLALVTKALTQLAPNLDSDADWAHAFCELIAGVTDRDEGDTDGDGELQSDEADVLWAVIEDRLHAEFNRPQGGFARLMNGETPQASRRMLQLAFNRPNSFPRVLVAQSLVGREGLNLHLACRTVVLLHPEWNPGVVEQQIGRVDRVGSHWERSFKARQGDSPLPYIMVRPVIFQGTYDEHNWQVLRDRWDDHRAHLHGTPIPHRLAFDDAESAELIRQLAAAAPNFSPLAAEQTK